MEVSKTIQNKRMVLRLRVGGTYQKAKRAGEKKRGRGEEVFIYNSGPLAPRDLY